MVFPGARRTRSHQDSRRSVTVPDVSPSSVGAFRVKPHLPQKRRSAAFAAPQRMQACGSSVEESAVVDSIPGPAWSGSVGSGRAMGQSEIDDAEIEFWTAPVGDDEGIGEGGGDDEGAGGEVGATGSTVGGDPNGPADGSGGTPP